MSKINRPILPVGLILAGCDEEDLNFLTEEDRQGLRQFMSEHGIALKRNDADKNDDEGVNE